MFSTYRAASTLSTMQAPLARKYSNDQGMAARAALGLPAAQYSGGNNTKIASARNQPWRIRRFVWSDNDRTHRLI